MTHIHRDDVFSKLFGCSPDLGLLVLLSSSQCFCSHIWSWRSSSSLSSSSIPTIAWAGVISNSSFLTSLFFWLLCFVVVFAFYFLLFLIFIYPRRSLYVLFLSYFSLFHQLSQRKCVIKLFFIFWSTSFMQQCCGDEYTVPFSHYVGANVCVWSRRIIAVAYKTRDSISKVVILQCMFSCLPPPFPFLYCFSACFSRGRGCARVVLSTGPKCGAAVKFPNPVHVQPWETATTIHMGPPRHVESHVRYRSVLSSTSMHDACAAWWVVLHRLQQVRISIQ